MPKEQLEEFVSQAPTHWPIWNTALKRLKELEFKKELSGVVTFSVHEHCACHKRKNSLEATTMPGFATQDIFDRKILQEIKARALDDIPEQG